MSGHCCEEGSREHEYKAYWRKREDERLRAAAHERWKALMRQANNNPNWPGPRLPVAPERPVVGIRGFFRWLFGKGAML